MIDVFGGHMDVELQQRSVEFSSLFSKHDNLRPSLFERMPPMENKSQTSTPFQNGQATEEELTNEVDNKDINDIKDKQETV